MTGDEADDMLRQGFREEVKTIINFIPKNASVCLFSRTSGAAFAPPLDHTALQLVQSGRWTEVSCPLAHSSEVIVASFHGIAGASAGSGAVFLEDERHLALAAAAHQGQPHARGLLLQLPPRVPNFCRGAPRPSRLPRPSQHARATEGRQTDKGIKDQYDQIVPA